MFPVGVKNNNVMIYRNFPFEGGSIWRSVLYVNILNPQHIADLFGNPDKDGRFPVNYNEIFDLHKIVIYYPFFILFKNP